MEPTNAQVESLIRNYQSFYQIPSIAKVKSKAEVIGYILKYLRPDDGRLVMAGIQWKDSPGNPTNSPATPGVEYPEPTEQDVVPLTSLSMDELKTIVKTYNDYYQIVKNFRDVNKDVKMTALRAKTDVMPGATKKEAIWYDKQARFEIIIGNVPEKAPRKLEAPIPKKLEAPAPLDWEEEEFTPEQLEKFAEGDAMRKERIRLIKERKAEEAEAEADAKKAEAREAEARRLKKEAEDLKRQRYNDAIKKRNAEWAKEAEEKYKAEAPERQAKADLKKDAAEAGKYAIGIFRGWPINEMKYTIYTPDELHIKIRDLYELASLVRHDGSQRPTPKNRYYNKPKLYGEDLKAIKAGETATDFKAYIGAFLSKAPKKKVGNAIVSAIPKPQFPKPERPSWLSSITDYEISKAQEEEMGSVPPEEGEEGYIHPPDKKVLSEAAKWEKDAEEGVQSWFDLLKEYGKAVLTPEWFQTYMGVAFPAKRAPSPPTRAPSPPKRAPSAPKRAPSPPNSKFKVGNKITMSDDVYQIVPRDFTVPNKEYDSLYMKKEDGKAARKFEVLRFGDGDLYLVKAKNSQFGYTKAIYDENVESGNSPEWNQKEDKLGKTFAEMVVLERNKGRARNDKVANYDSVLKL